MIEYRSDIATLRADQLHGFFVGWPVAPAPAKPLAVLHGSYRVVIAVEMSDGRVVGFIHAISDGVLTAFVPWLEVLPSHQGRGAAASWSGGCSTGSTTCTRST